MSRYIVEADNPDETYSVVGRFDNPEEMDRALWCCAELETLRDSPRRLTMWCTSPPTLIATWTPPLIEETTQ